MRRRFVAALGSAALVVAGCGDDDEKSSSGGSKPLTKAQYIAKADDICRDVEQATKPFEDQLDALTPKDDVKELASPIQGTVVEQRKGRARLRALRAPSEDKATLDAYYATHDRTLRLARELQKVAETNDAAKVRTLLRDNQGVGSEQKRLARQYGFKECGLN